MSTPKKESGAMHRVKVSMGYTRNMGDFESLRMDIGLEQDGYGHPNATWEKVFTWTEKKMLESFRAVEDQLRAAKKSK